MTAGMYDCMIVTHKEVIYIDNRFLSIRIDVAMYLALLMVIAERARHGHHTTLSDVVRNALTMYLQHEESDKTQ